MQLLILLLRISSVKKAISEGGISGIPPDHSPPVTLNMKTLSMDGDSFNRPQGEELNLLEPAVTVKFNGWIALRALCWVILRLGTRPLREFSVQLEAKDEGRILPSVDLPLIGVGPTLTQASPPLQINKQVL